MSCRQRRQRCPSLSAWRNVLPLFFANEALPRRDTARRVLGAAGGANKRVHLTAPRTCVLCHWLYAIPPARHAHALWIILTSANATPACMRGRNYVTPAREHVVPVANLDAMTRVAGTPPMIWTRRRMMFIAMNR